MEGFDQLDILSGTSANASILLKYLQASGWYGNLFPGQLSERISTRLGFFGYGRSLVVGMSTSGSGSLTRAYRSLFKRYTQDYSGGIRVSLESPGTTGVQLGLYDNTNSRHNFQIGFDPLLGSIFVRDSGGNIIARSRIGAFYLNVPFYLTFRWFSGTPARLEVWVNGEVMIDVSSTSLGSGYDAFFLGNQGAIGGPYTYPIDDLYGVVADGVGHQGPLGNIIVGALRPQGAGSKTEWTSVGAPTNWQAARSYQGVIDNTIYNQTDTIGAEDLYSLDAPMAATSIFGIQLTNFFRQTDGLQRKGQNSLLSDGNIYRSLPSPMNSGFGALHSFYETDPSTGIPWTPPTLGAIEVGGRFEGTE